MVIYRLLLTPLLSECSLTYRSSKGRYINLYLTNFRKRKTHRHSLESRRKQRIARNKRKREEKTLSKRGLTTSVQDLKRENESLIRKFSVESAIKEKYFEMWRASEKEKDKIKNARLVLKGCRQIVATNNEAVPNISKDILNIDPSLLEDVHVDNASHELGIEDENKLPSASFSVLLIQLFMCLAQGSINHTETAPFLFPDEIAEVAMAILPFLFKSSAKDGLCKQRAFLHFLPVSTVII